MGGEELLLRRQEGVAGAEDGPEGRRHLQQHKHEDEGPHAQAAAEPRVELLETAREELHAEAHRDGRKRQVQRAHRRHGLGALREDPRHGREADEQHGGEREQARHEAAYFRQPRVRAAQAREDVEARQADEAGEEQPARNLHRRGPKLVAARERPDHHPVGQRTEDGDAQQHEGELQLSGLRKLEPDASRLPQQSFAGREEVADGHAFGGIGARRTGERGGRGGSWLFGWERWRLHDVVLVCCWEGNGCPRITRMNANGSGGLPADDADDADGTRRWAATRVGSRSMNPCRRLAVAARGRQQFGCASTTPPATRRLQVAGTGSCSRCAAFGPWWLPLNRSATVLNASRSIFPNAAAGLRHNRAPWLHSRSFA